MSEREKLAEQLLFAWGKYETLFGEPPHGTGKQLRALVELMIPPIPDGRIARGALEKIVALAGKRKTDHTPPCNCTVCEMSNIADAALAPDQPVKSEAGKPVACSCDVDHPMFKERGHHPLCPAFGTPTGGERVALADEIESWEGLSLMMAGTTKQLGIKKTAMVIAALRASPSIGGGRDRKQIIRIVLQAYGFADSALEDQAWLHGTHAYSIAEKIAAALSIPQAEPGE